MRDASDAVIILSVQQSSSENLRLN